MTATRRRWFACCLGTLFVVVTLICCWLGYSLHWIKQRSEAWLHKGNDYSLSMTRFYTGFEPGEPQSLTIRPPLSLRLFVARGVVLIRVSNPAVDMDRLRRLFPEAEVVFQEPFVEWQYSGPPGGSQYNGKSARPGSTGRPTH